MRADPAHQAEHGLDEQRRRHDRVRIVVESRVKLSQLEPEGAPKSENVALLTAALGALAQPY